MIAVPGAREATIVALVGSALPGQLAALGWHVEKIGESQRILPHAVSQKLTVRADGELEPFVEGSSKPVTMVITNAGVANLECYDLRMPDRSS
jgi:hypothetical protein